MAEGPSRIPPVASSISKAQQAARAEKMRERAMAQEATQEAFSEWADTFAFNPLAMQRRFERLDDRFRKALDESGDVKESDDSELIEKVGKSAEDFERRNPELAKRALMELHALLRKETSSGNILSKVLNMFPDPSNADEAMQFLLEALEGESKAATQKAMDDLNRLYGREVRAGHNMGAEARTYSKHGLGTPSHLRDLYRDITGNPRDGNTLFHELTGMYDYEKMEEAITFLQSALNKDLKAKGPSIEPSELQKLINDTRNMRDILALYRYFKGHMPLLNRSFQLAGLTIPSIMNFESVTRQFMAMIEQKYPSATHAFNMAAELGLNEELIAQSLLFNKAQQCMRDGVSPRFFKDDKHRQDVADAIREAIEEIEEMLEKEYEEQEKREKQERDDEEF